MFNNYYPETLGIAAILNAPWIFSACWTIIKVMLDPVTASKIAFLKPAQLKEFMNDEDIPVDLGGTSDYDFLKEYVIPSERKSVKKKSSRKKQTELDTSASEQSTDETTKSSKSKQSTEDSTSESSKSKSKSKSKKKSSEE